MPRLLLLSLLLLAPDAFAQNEVISSAETDQAVYAYGEQIELRYKITNASDEDTTLVAYTGSNCPVGIEFGPLPEPRFCFTDAAFFDFAPYSSRTWVWHIIPSEHGVPVTSGDQTVTAFFGFNRFPATASFTAPQYLGGRIYLSLAEGIALQDVQDVLGALNAVVVHAGPYGRSYLIETAGTTLEEAVATYESDARFDTFESRRVIAPADVIYTVDAEEDTPGSTSPVLASARPNPFSSSTSFALTVPDSGPTRVEVFDVLGRRVAILHDGPLAAGPEHHFTFRAAALPSGLYVVRATGQGFTQTRRVTLSR